MSKKLRVGDTFYKISNADTDKETFDPMLWKLLAENKVFLMDEPYFYIVAVVLTNDEEIITLDKRCFVKDYKKIKV